MQKDRHGSFWWWFLGTLFVGGCLGLLILLWTDRHPDTTPVAPGPANKGARRDTTKIVEKAPPAPAPEAPRPSNTLTEEERFRLAEKELTEFLAYVEKTSYFLHLNPEKSALQWWRETLGRLTANPPVPAGEGIDARYMSANLHYFFRVLQRADLRLVRAFLQNEESSMEAHLDMLYRWLTLCRKCPSSISPRPPEAVLYHYAGFFLNTLGGRGYLFRRAPEVRILVSYYALLILFEADRKGLNSYGVDVFPLVDPIAREMARYPELQFSQEYLSRLKEIQRHYSGRR